MKSIIIKDKKYIKQEQIKSIEYYKKHADYVYSYDNGDYVWGKDGVYHLMRNGKEIASGDEVHSYDNGDYEWKKDGIIYKMNKKETTLNVDGEVYELEG